MSWNRPTAAQLEQFASQTAHVSVAELRAIEKLLPIEETPDFLLGLLVGLGVGYEADEQQREALGKVIAVLAERILQI
jgi:hypothetical protein